MNSGRFVRFARFMTPSAPLAGFASTPAFAMNGRKAAQGVGSLNARKYAPVPPSDTPNT